MLRVTHDDLMNEFDHQGLLRNVVSSDIFLLDGTKIADKKALLFADTGEYVSTVGKTFQPVDRVEVYSNIATSLLQSGIDLTNFSVTHHTGRNAAREMTQITLPAHIIEPMKDDQSAMQVLVKDSYDGSLKFTTDVGAIRFICSNGMINASLATAYSRRHRSQMTVEELIERIKFNIDAFTSMGEQWAKMAGIKLTRQQAKAKLLAYLGRDESDVEKVIKLEEARADSDRETNAGMLFEKYEEQIATLGESQWNLFNTMTWFSTHKTKDADNMMLMQNRIPKILTAA